MSLDLLNIILLKLAKASQCFQCEIFKECEWDGLARHENCRRGLLRESVFFFIKNNIKKGGKAGKEAFL